MQCSTSPRVRVDGTIRLTAAESVAGRRPGGMPPDQCDQSRTGRLASVPFGSSHPTLIAPSCRGTAGAPDPGGPGHSPTTDAAGARPGVPARSHGRYFSCTSPGDGRRTDAACRTRMAGPTRPTPEAVCRTTVTVQRLGSRVAVRGCPSASSADAGCAYPKVRGSTARWLAPSTTAINARTRRARERAFHVAANRHPPTSHLNHIINSLDIFPKRFTQAGLCSTVG